jgi:hypothetical protein
MPLTTPPTAPSTADPSTFSTRMDATLAWLATNVTEMNAFQAALTALAAGGAMAIPYTFSATTTDADPGAGYLRLDNATQNIATTIRADLAGADGSTWTSVLDTFDDSTSTVKGHIMLQKMADATKWILFSVSALASPSGYKNIAAAVVASSAASPFSDGDSIVLKFTRNGDKGDAGAAGANSAMLLLSAVTASASATVDIETTFDGTYDAYLLVASGVKTSADGAVLQSTMKISGAYDTGNNYKYHCATLKSDASTYSADASNASGSINIMNSGIGNAANEGAAFSMMIFNPSSTALSKRVTWHGSGITAAGLEVCYTGSAHNTGTAALTGIRFFPSSGNIASGTFRLYGIKNS